MIRVPRAPVGVSLHRHSEKLEGSSYSAQRRWLRASEQDTDPTRKRRRPREVDSAQEKVRLN